MPIPNSRPPSQPHRLTGWEYIHSPAYAKHIYNNNDFFTMSGKVSVYVKEYILDNVSDNFHGLLQGITDPTFTELYAAELASAEPVVYTLLARDMRLPDVKELYGGTWRHIVETGESDTKRVSGSQSSTTGLVQGTSTGATKNAIGEVTTVGTAVSDVASHAVSGTETDGSTTVGATRTQSSSQGTSGSTASGSGSTTTDNASVNLQSGRAGSGAVATSDGEGRSGNVTSSFPMVIDAGGTSASSIDNWLSGGGAGNVSRYADNGGKSATTSTSEANNGNVSDSVGGAISVTSGNGSNSSSSESASTSGSLSTSLTDQTVNASTAVTNGENETAQNTNTRTESTVGAHESVSTSETESSSTSASSTTGQSTDVVGGKTGRVVDETGSASTYAQTEIYLNEALSGRTSALDYLRRRLETFWTIRFGSYPGEYEYYDRYPI